MFQGCFGVVPGCSGGIPGMFWGVPGVFRGVPGYSGSVPGFTDTLKVIPKENIVSIRLRGACVMQQRNGYLMNLL